MGIKIKLMLAGAFLTAIAGVFVYALNWQNAKGIIKQVELDRSTQNQSLKQGANSRGDYDLKFTDNYTNPNDMPPVSGDKNKQKPQTPPTENPPETSPTLPSNPPSKSIKYTCPGAEYVDCMPKVIDDNSKYFSNEPDYLCTQEFLQWARENCPGFAGAAY